MTYALEHGDEQQVLEQYAANAMAAPKWAETAPEIPFGSDWVYSAFWCLSADRSIGWGAGPIPWTAIRDYHDAFGWAADSLEEFASLIRAMDAAFLAYDRAQRDK